MLLLYFVSLLVYALIERELAATQLHEEGLDELHLYPEKRATMRTNCRSRLVCFLWGGDVIICWMPRAHC